MNYRVSNIEVLFLKMLKNIENKCFFMNTWVYFQENILHFDILGFLAFLKKQHFNVGHPVIHIQIKILFLINSHSYHFKKYNSMWMTLQKGGINKWICQNVSVNLPVGSMNLPDGQREDCVRSAHVREFFKKQRHSKIREYPYRPNPAILATLFRKKKNSVDFTDCTK